MSKSIQTETIQSMETRIATKQPATWMTVIEEIAGDNEHLMNYLPTLKCIESSNRPFELSIRFTTIKGQFASSEGKMTNLLTEANFVSEIDFCAIECESESELLISYNCLKLFIMDRADIDMIKALIIGEQIYSMYKGSPIEMQIKLSPRTHFMIVEQFKCQDQASIYKTSELLAHPPAILVIYAGSKTNLLKKYETVKKNTNMYGRVIAPPTCSIYANGANDALRISQHLIETLGNPYKAELRKSLGKTGKAPTKIGTWGFVFKSSMFAVNPNMKLSFTFEDIVKETKFIYINMLAQQHVDTQALSDDEYYACIDKWEAKRQERLGYFSALKTLSASMLAAKIQLKKDSKGKKTTKVNTPAPASTAPTTTNGYETGGSDHEQDQEEAEVEEEEAEEEAEEEEAEEEEEQKPTKKQVKKAASKPKTDIPEEKAPAKPKAKSAKTASETKAPAKPKGKTRKSASVVEELPDSDSD